MIVLSVSVFIKVFCIPQKKSPPSATVFPKLIPQNFRRFAANFTPSQTFFTPIPYNLHGRWFWGFWPPMVPQTLRGGVSRQHKNDSWFTSELGGHWSVNWSPLGPSIRIFFSKNQKTSTVEFVTNILNMGKNLLRNGQEVNGTVLKGKKINKKMANGRKNNAKKLSGGFWRNYAKNPEFQKKTGWKKKWVSFGGRKKTGWKKLGEF